MEPIDNTTFNM